MIFSDPLFQTFQNIVAENESLENCHFFHFSKNRKFELKKSGAFILQYRIEKRVIKDFSL